MPNLSLEISLQARGFLKIAGVDEAGRGPLAGPVAAAAVILPLKFRCRGLDDSKKLPAPERERLYEKITSHPSVVWAFAIASCDEIERLNILRATHLAMRRAVESLADAPHHCLIDGLPVRDFPFPHDGIVKGDGRSLSIAAASIIAKVRRDRIMAELHNEYPHFGFARHKGYGTKEHLEALRIHGPCCHHRRTFEPVAQLTLPLGGV